MSIKTVLIKTAKILLGIVLGLILSLVTVVLLDALLPPSNPFSRVVPKLWLIALVIAFWILLSTGFSAEKSED